MVETTQHGNLKVKVYTGGSILVVFLAVFAILFAPTYNEYYTIDDNGIKTLVARETINIWDGTKQMRAKSRTNYSEDLGTMLRITKKAFYKENITVTEVQLIDKNNKDIEQFPLNSYFDVDWGYSKNKIISFTYSKLLDTLKTEDISAPFRFNPNMKLEWQEGAYYTKSKHYKTVKDKIIIKYRAKKQHERYYIRLFDPVDVFHKEDIVRQSKVIELNDMTKCIYRTYKNPTKLEYCLDLQGNSNKISGNEISKKTEVKVIEEIDYMESVCISKKIYDPKNDSYNEEITCHDEKRTKNEEVWESIENICLDPAETTEFRSCYTKQNNLDSYLYEDHVPAFDYDLKEYTVIGSSGFNQTINPTVFNDTFNRPNAPEIGNGWTDNDAGNTVDIFSNTARIIKAPSGTPNFNRAWSTLPQNIGFSWKANDAGSTFALHWQVNSDNTKRTAIIMNIDKMYYQDDGGTTDIQAVSDNTYYTVELKNMTESTYDIWVDGVLKIDDADMLSDATRTTLQTYFAQGAATTMNVDWFNNTNTTTVFGAYNSSGTFNQVNITSDCSGDSNYINISRNSTSFETTTSATQHNWGEQVNGFYFKVNTDECSFVFLEIGNLTTGDDPPSVELISPANNINTSTLTNDFIGNASDDFNLINVSFYVNSTLNQTNSSGINDTNYTFSLTLSINDSISWLFEACDNNSQCTNTTARVFFTFSESPLVAQISPANNTNISTLTNDFICNASDDTSLFDVSLYINGTLNQTNSSGINDTNYTFPLTLPIDYSITWLCEACGDNSECTNTTSRNFFTFSLVNITRIQALPIKYNPDWGVLNWSDIINSTIAKSGNYTWNFSEDDIELFNLSATNFLFNLTNNILFNTTAALKQNSSEQWYDWICGGVNITSSYANVVNITVNTSELINCTLDLRNISQTYENWTLILNNATWNISYDFRFKNFEP